MFTEGKINVLPNGDHMPEEFRGGIRSLDVYRLHLNHQSKAVIPSLSNALNLITLQISGTRVKGFQWDYLHKES